MAVPKKRKSPSKRDSRRAANSKISVRSPATCSRCGQSKVPHHVCPHCGYYKNKQILAVEDGSGRE
ncbi:MAG: 50S ribosomal protein L32 [Pseudomonadota bacterium]